MVGIINPSSNQTLDDYKKRASALSKGVTPGASTYGGKLIDSDDADDKSDDKDDKNSSSKGDSSKNDKDAAVSVRVPVFSLLGAVGLVFFMA